MIEASDLDYTILRPGWFTRDGDVSYQLTQKGEPFKGHDVSLNGSQRGLTLDENLGARAVELTLAVLDYGVDFLIRPFVPVRLDPAHLKPPGTFGQAFRTESGPRQNCGWEVLTIWEN